MVKLFGAISVGLALIALSAWLLVAPPTTTQSVAAEPAKAAATADEDLPDRQALNSRLDQLEREITSDAGP